jgi:hypothetical protein
MNRQEKVLTINKKKLIELHNLFIFKYERDQPTRFLIISYFIFAILTMNTLKK